MLKSNYIRIRGFGLEDMKLDMKQMKKLEMDLIDMNCIKQRKSQ